MICHQCGTELHLGRIPGRLETCSQCGAHLHCCLNCRFYDTTMANQCQEPQAELVRDKAAPNFCEFFLPGAKPEARQRQAEADEARKAFEKLFKG